VTTDGKLIMCPMCHQTGCLRPTYTTDDAGHACLTWTCSNCAGTWRTAVAGPGAVK
jgi:hypothetical protein